MSQEENGNGMSSYEDAAGKSGGEDSSLAARRARLRGTLAKQAVPPDPFVPDPYMNAAAPQPAAVSAPPDPALQEDRRAHNAPVPTVEMSRELANLDMHNALTNTHPDILPDPPAPAPPPPPPAPAPEPIPPDLNPSAAEQAYAAAAEQAYAQNQAYAQALMQGQQAQNYGQEQPQAAQVQQSYEDQLAQYQAQEQSYASDLAPQAVPPAASDPAPAPTAVPTQQDVTVQDQKLQHQHMQVQSQMQTQAMELLNSIDQAMGACAMNLSGLQKIAGEQTETLRTLAETMQNQSLFEIGLTLNTLTESLSAALEPMKAVGELVPAIDQLVSVLESREGNPEDNGRLSPDQLVTNLADQLSTGMIDPWTFKCAYMAVYPADHPADLLHRLVDLLGTQRLSGDLFRAAYDAVQAAEPPASYRAPASQAEPEVRTVVKVMPDESMLKELEELRNQVRDVDELRKQNDELKSQGEVGGKRVEQREEEFAELLAAKEQELQEAQELLNSRWEEFNTRYDELTETLQKRDEMIQEKEAEVAKKESENAQLRAQVDELRDQTKEMFAEMQKQLMKPKEEPAAPAAKPAGFFDPAPSPQQNANLFEAAPAKPLFQPAPEAPPPQPPPQPAPQMMAPPQPPAPPTPAPPTPQQSQQTQAVSAANQAVPKPAPQPTTPFMTGAGSYGSGVRAQVFEVIVRQALAGAPWREICAGPMQVNNITADEVEAEVKRRQALLGKK